MRRDKMAFATTTFSRADTDPKRFPLIEKALLSQAKSPIKKYLIVDNFRDKLHGAHIAVIERAERQGFEVVWRENGGVSRAKNTCIRKILQDGYEYGMLLDDDVEVIQSNFADYYLEAMEAGIDHLCGFFDNYASEKIIAMKKATVFGSLTVEKTPIVHGALLTFTKRLIEKIGYFPDFKYGYGHEHSHFTKRAVSSELFPRGFYDVFNSNKYIHLADEQAGIVSFPDRDEAAMKENEKTLTEPFEAYYPCIE